MTFISWITLLTLSVFLSGCGVLENLFIAGGPAQPPVVPRPVEPEPPALYLLRGDIAFPMDRGSYCWSTGDGGICVDAVPPSYTAEMHTRVIGHTLELLFDEPFPDTVTAALHPGSSLMTRVPDLLAEAALDENGRVLVTVPDHLNGNYVLIVSATWSAANMPQGDAFYTAPIRFSP